MCREVNQRPSLLWLHPVKVNGPQRRPARLARGGGSRGTSKGNDPNSKTGTQARVSRAEITEGSQRPPPGRKKLPREYDAGPWAVCKPAGAAQETEAVQDESTWITPSNLH